MNETINWQRFVEKIHSAKTILLTAHQRPDADCIGSELAMFGILTQLGKNVRIVNPHKTPQSLHFLDSSNRICAVETLSEQERQLEDIDLILVLDTSSWQQLGAMAEIFKASKAEKMVLDHHIKGDDIGAEKFIDHTAEATGALVIQAAEELGVPLTKEIAEPAFAALATDTGWFRFSSVQSKTFYTAGKLLDSGVRPETLYRNLYEQESFGRIRLVGRTLSKTESLAAGRFLLTWIRLEDFDNAGAVASDSEDIINMLLQVKGSKVAVLISELRDKMFKVSFRSRCKIDCSNLAAYFGGGGHKKAAGASLALPFEETKKAIIAAVLKALDEAGE